VLIPLLSFGCFSAAALLYAGVRTRSRNWLSWGAGYLVVNVVAFLLWTQDANVGNIDTQIGSAGLAVQLVLLAVVSVHALAIREEFLEQISGGPRRRTSLERAERKLEERERALEMVREDPLKARELGIGRPDLRGGHHGHLVDLNHASADAIAKLPRVDAKTAERLAALRDEVGGFDSLEDAGNLLDLPPLTVERLRGQAVCLPY
jgi:membrane protein implicated in regulation of membrane protease activity